MIRHILFALGSISSIVSHAEQSKSQEIAHDFFGKHFVASYLGCDPEAIRNLEQLKQAMDHAVNASGATILQKNHHEFPPDGLTIVYLLSESHASLHTYPEFGACFVDLFTCGTQCSAESFDQALREYLHPKEINARFFVRDEGIHEISYELPSKNS